MQHTHKKKVILAALIAVLALSTAVYSYFGLDEIRSMLSTVTGQPIGMMTGQTLIKVEKYIPVDFTYEPAYYTIPLSYDGKLTSVDMSGRILGDGAVKAYIITDDEEIQVFYKEGIKQSKPSLVAEGSDNIGITLEYGKDSIWDPNNNGWTQSDGIIDFKVNAKDLDERIDGEKLCTEWMVSSIENSVVTKTCLGDVSCCNYLGYAGTQGSRYDEPFFLVKSNYGATENNVVAARIAYVDINLRLDELRKDVVFSDTLSLSAVFKDINSEFKKACEKSCTMSVKDTPAKLVIEIGSDSRVYLDDVRYFQAPL